MSFQKHLTAAGLALGLCWAAAGAKVEIDAPVVGADARMAYYPIAGGVSGEGTADGNVLPKSSNSVNVEYRLAAAEIGGTFVSEEPVWRVGDFLAGDDIPPRIDWQETLEAMAAGEAVANGRVKIYPSSQDANRRILLVGGGSVGIDWVTKSAAGGVLETNTSYYYVGKVVSERPHRLFWTEGGSKDNPYAGPTVSLAGKFIEILGEPSIVGVTYAASSVQGVSSNVVRGVYRDSAGILHARADANGVGPKGQFVIAYYDTADLRRLIGTTVVEVLPPDPQTVQVHVGERLLPTGGGYGIEGLSPFVVKGTEQTVGDTIDGSPWIELFVPRSQYSPKYNAYYAISPTDATTGAKAHPQDADIYWESPDELKTLWPFEEVWYEISWNPDDPKLVTAAPNTVGCPLNVPTNYTATLCAYMVPGALATIDSDNMVTVDGETLKKRDMSMGHFTIKLMFDDDVRYLPVAVVDRTDTSVGDDTRAIDATVDVGETLKPLPGELFSNLPAGYAALFTDPDGYICQRYSAKVWNPNLYHEPRQQAIAGQNTKVPGVGEEDEEEDPFAKLDSAICLVSPSPDPVEVWWYRSVTEAAGGEILPTPVKIAGFVNRYASAWPTTCHEIALTSQLGSGVPTAACEGRAISFGATNDAAVAAGAGLGTKRVFSAAEAVSIGAFLKMHHRGPSGNGRLLTAAFADGSSVTVDLTTGSKDTPQFQAKSTLANGAGGWVTKTGNSVSAANSIWSQVVVSLSPTGSTGERQLNVILWDGVNTNQLLAASSVCGETELVRVTLGYDEVTGVPGASGYAADELTLWDLAVTGDMLKAYWANDGKGGEKIFAEHELAHFACSSLAGESVIDDEEDRARYVIGDGERGYLLLVGAPTWLEPGAPVKRAVFLRDGDVTPRIYRQTDDRQPGLRPNYEHAFIGSDGTVWALRTAPIGQEECGYVLVERAEDGRGAMSVFKVVQDTENFPAQTMTTAGLQLLPPYPLRLLEGYWTRETTYDGSTEINSSASAQAAQGGVAFRDRKLNDWAVHEGSDTAHYSYLLRSDFDRLDVEKASIKDGYIRWQVKNWNWSVSWPETAPVLKVGQTLTKAVTGLPEVWNMASCDILYPKREGNAAKNTVVQLVDPVTAKTASLPIKSQFTEEYGFKTGPSGDCQLRQGKYYFPGLPPSIVDRFYVDTSAAESNRVVLVGDLQEPAAGNAYLRWNLLSKDEREALLEIVPKKDVKDPGFIAWTNAVETLAKKTIADIVAEPDTPVANYALFANGNGAGYVTFIENNSTNKEMVAEEDPIDVKVICVTNELYAGTVSTIANKLNKLSEQLTVQYNDAFPGMEDQFELLWEKAPPKENGDLPTSWSPYGGGENKKSFVLGKTGTTLSELANTYYRLTYKPKGNTPAAATCGDQSVTTDPALAEGWVQRVLNALTPFAQRVEDFYSNPSDIWFTMFEQIGRPYQGDVALNNDNLTEVGLAELYRTIFEKAWKMSMAVGVHEREIDKQLLLAASRIADLYQLLGAEAYADAKNPLISQGLPDAPNLEEFESLPSSTFSFQGQVRTLLDEELALLRGRSAANAPNMTTQPVFNRLYWNIDKDITGGEVAYVLNYGIRAEDGVLTIDQAAKQYPQGHGDAWGHYLSSIQLYYRLLRNENYDWYATMTEMNLSQAPANVDYQDEQKFADSAVKLAQIGLDAVDLTARQAWRDNAGEQRGGYADANTEQAFGYGEWATRSMLGGIYNWATVNALTPPPAAAGAAYDDSGLKRIDRATVTQLGELCMIVNQIQQRVNTLDAGLNPLGLSQNAIPMDIDPDELESRNSHFEQILERAERALQNCDTVLEFANKFGTRLQQIQDKETTAIDEQRTSETDFNRELIAIYGTPYPEDIGTGCLYPQGYDGPDLYHYMYMDLDEYGLSEKELATSFTTNMTLYKVLDNYSHYADAIVTNGVRTCTFEVTSGGIIRKADKYKGVRLTEGKLQTAYREYLTAYVTATRAVKVYDAMKKGLTKASLRAYKTFALKDTRLTMGTAIDTAGFVLKLLNMKTKDMAANALNIETNAQGRIAFDGKQLPSLTILGTATSTNPQDIYHQSMAMITHSLFLKRMAAMESSTITENALKYYELITGEVLKAWDFGVENWENYNTLKDAYLEAVIKVNTAADEAQTAIAALSAAEAAYRAAVDEGEALQAQREAARKRQSNKATMYRYADMFNRVQRNNALTKYATAFDTAQRYVWELAKVYDYETGLLSGDPQAGDRFLAEIIGARQLGEPDISTSQATDKGLYDIVNRMKENWANLKGRLGVNNPQETASEFSLRYELFRIRPDASGDEAWRQELEKHWTEDILQDSDFLRHCQPMASANAPVAKEPGLIIPFATSINNAENFFGRMLQGGDSAYASSDYATKIYAVGIGFTGYEELTERTSSGLAANPYVYLVPVGRDYMRVPSEDRTVLGWTVIDQVLPLPYTVGSTQLDDDSWISTFSGLDGTRDSAAKLRRHSMFRADGETYATRLVGRSVWNDRWILVIPASSLNANREAGLRTFIDGVKDIKLCIRAYSRQGN